MTQGESWTEVTKCSPSRKFLEFNQNSYDGRKTLCYRPAPRLYVFVFGSKAEFLQ